MTDHFNDTTNPAIPSPAPSRSVCRRLAEQAPEEMAAALRALGWVCYRAGEGKPARINPAPDGQLREAAREVLDVALVGDPPGALVCPTAFCAPLRKLHRALAARKDGE